MEQDKLIFCVGDIHGCNLALIRIMNKIHSDRDGKPALIVFLGDYTDRGPDSHAVIEHLLDLKNSKTYPEVEYVFLRGNHDQMLMDYVAGNGNDGMWSYNGGAVTLDSYYRAGARIEDHVNTFFKYTKPMHRYEDFVFVHANLNPFYDIDNQVYDELIWTRNYNNYNGLYKENVFVVHGHTPVEKPDAHANQLNIDTGCVYQLKYPNDFKLGLTAVRFDSRKDYRFLHASQIE